MYEILVAARTSHSVNYGELVIGAFIALFGSLFALNVRGCAEFVVDFLGRLISAFHHNDLVLRIPAGFLAVAGTVLVLINLKIALFGF
ncbi:hypothetical protein OG890_37430 [Streptomyces anulatus]|uniref:hypothetical protein n=1 Tax=Streptomyces anulatus TaxID=1892 RepID=UPI002259BAA3|nr:hypothetical protein [Streptomyces anulatus]MCX4489572.1 hypothetical protein [Streptomyces anulatus]